MFPFSFLVGRWAILEEGRGILCLSHMVPLVYKPTPSINLLPYTFMAMETQWERREKSREKWEKGEERDRWDIKRTFDKVQDQKRGFPSFLVLEKKEIGEISKELLIKFKTKNEVSPRFWSCKKRLRKKRGAKNGDSRARRALLQKFGACLSWCQFKPPFFRMVECLLEIKE